MMLFYKETKYNYYKKTKKKSVDFLTTYELQSNKSALLGGRKRKPSGYVFVFQSGNRRQGLDKKECELQNPIPNS